jgi:hypothetical protein
MPNGKSGFTENRDLGSYFSNVLIHLHIQLPQHFFHSEIAKGDALVFMRKGECFFDAISEQF